MTFLLYQVTFLPENELPEKGTFGKDGQKSQEEESVSSSSAVPKSSGGDSSAVVIGGGATAGEADKVLKCAP